MCNVSACTDNLYMDSKRCNIYIFYRESRIDLLHDLMLHGGGYEILEQ
jgi:hypothetical protein